MIPWPNSFYEVKFYSIYQNHLRSLFKDLSGKIIEDKVAGNLHFLTIVYLKYLISKSVMRFTPRVNKYIKKN